MRYLTRYFLPILAVSLILGISNTSLTYAIELSESVEYVQGVARPYWQSSHNETAHQGSYSFGNNFDYTSTNWIRLKTASNTNLTVEAGNFVSITGKVIAYSSVGGNASTNVLSQPYTVWGPGAATSADGVDCNLVDYSFDTYIAYSSTSYEYTYNFEWICRATNGDITNPVTNFWVNNRNPGTGGTTRADLNIARITVWKPVDGVDINTIISRINAVNNNINTLNGKIDTTNEKLDSLVSKAEELADSQAQANQDANDRYQDEKDTISENGSDAQDTANNAQFGFNIGNPLTTWIGLFVDSNCVDIPTIANWIHSNETRVCSPWSDQVRAVTTPIIGVLSGTILFGFLVNWLKNKDGQELS